MKPDKYYGSRAKNYDAERQGTRYWQREQEAVNELVTNGPVLDVPVGTARFGEIYEQKGLKWTGIDISEDMLKEARRKFPNADLRQGNIFKLPFADKEFGTVVCNRLLYFFTPDEMRKAVQELCRVAETPVISIRTGKEGIPKTLGSYTHSELKFFEAIGSRLLVKSKELSRSTTDIHRMMSFRDFNFQNDYLNQFLWHKGGVKRAQELADKWFQIFNVTGFNVLEGSNAHVEYWPVSRLASVMQDMIYAAEAYGYPHTMNTDEKPRYKGGPPVIVLSQGKYGMIDGRRRSNQLINNQPGITPVVIVEAGK